LIKGSLLITGLIPNLKTFCDPGDLSLLFDLDFYFLRFWSMIVGDYAIYLMVGEGS